ncbi:MAG: pirin family protein [Gammaproteobacteria bacterium]
MEIIRSVASVFEGAPATDGAGVKLTRIIGSKEINRLDPFLLFDVFESDQPGDYIAGFPLHPHRGFETVTYMLAGKMAHEDSAGHSGVIETGGVQWMTAARGIIHSEMPQQEDGLLRGVQLWINLPAELKMSPPDYREFDSRHMPVDRRDGSEARIIAGTSSVGLAGPVQGVVTEPLFADVTLAPGGSFTEPLPAGHSVILYVVSGSLRAGETALKARHLAVLGAGDTVQLMAGANTARVLLIAARALHEPIARGGPFVMNTRAEIHQAFDDYAAGRLLDEPAATQE